MPTVTLYVWYNIIIIVLWSQKLLSLFHHVMISIWYFSVFVCVHACNVIFCTGEARWWSGVISGKPVDARGRIVEGNLCQMKFHIMKFLQLKFAKWNFAKKMIISLPKKKKNSSPKKKRKPFPSKKKNLVYKKFQKKKRSAKTKQKSFHQLEIIQKH